VGLRRCLTNDNHNYMEKIAFTEETFGDCFHKVAIVSSNGNVIFEVKVANSVH
jgi:hypothetical protein